MLGFTPVKTVGVMKKPFPPGPTLVKASPPDVSVAPSSLPDLMNPRTRSYCVLVTSCTCFLKAVTKLS